MAAEFVPVDPFDLIIFGGTGDLARRKLLPSLYHRDRDGQFPDDSRIIAVSRQDWTHDDYIQWVQTALDEQLSDEKAEPNVIERFKKRLLHVQLDIDVMQDWQALSQYFTSTGTRQRTFYLATAPSLFGTIANGVAEAGLVDDKSRIVLEKPVGHDRESAQRINDAVGTHFDESQIFRIDHYLGKETVQNLIALRFGNSLFEPVWARHAVDNVQITVAESLGAGERFDFYEQTGALRDMVQNHMLQLLCLTAMEPPASMNHDDVRNEKLKVLRSLKPITPANVRTHTARGQYAAGMINGEAVPAYGARDADQQAPDRQAQAETFVALKAEIDNWRWQGVPFYLRTGKRLARKSSQIVIEFKPVPHSIFGDEPLQPNRLVLRLQPEEGVEMSIMTKEPGPGGFRMRSLPLNLSFSEAFEAAYPDAYERLLMEVLRGNPALFMRRDEVEAGWQWVDRIRKSWYQEQVEAQEYMAGSWGPTDAFVMLDRDGRRWHEQ